MIQKLSLIPATFVAASVLTISPLLSADARAAAVDVQVAGPIIELSVNETIESAPDTARISTGVSTKAATAQAALRENAQKMDAVIRKIKSLGIADKDIQTSGININAEFDYRGNEEPVLTGYRASNTVQLTVRDIDNLGEMIDALVGAGANNLNGPYFTLENDENVKAAARKRAMERGRMQAMDYARLAGYNDVRIVAISEAISGSSQVSEGYGKIRAQAVSMDVSTPVQPGQVGTNVTVNITYEMVR